MFPIIIFFFFQLCSPYVFLKLVFFFLHYSSSAGTAGENHQNILPLSFGFKAKVY